MKTKRHIWIAALALCLSLAGCGKAGNSSESAPASGPESETAASAAESSDAATGGSQYSEPAFQAIADGDESTLYLATDQTVNSDAQIPLSSDLAKDIAGFLDTVITEPLADEDIAVDPDYTSFIEVGAYNAPFVQVKLFRYPADHAKYPDAALYLLTIGEEIDADKTTAMLMDGGEYDQLYNLLDVASFTSDAPAEDFVVPVQQIIADYRDGKIDDSMREWFEPLPSGAELPEVNSPSDFEVVTQQGNDSLFSYSVVVPMSGGLAMQADIVYFDESGWGVGAVKFIDTPKT